MNEIIARLTIRGGTAVEWTLANPKLSLNELGRETDTGFKKWGDGVNHWNDLPYDFEVPNGGTTGQLLAKASHADRDVEWVDQSGGGGTTKLIARDNQISNSITGVTVETKLGNGLLIPANSVAAGDVLRVVFGIFVKGASGYSQAQLYINTSDSLSGANLLAYISWPITNANIVRHLNIRSSTQTECFFLGHSFGDYGFDISNVNPPTITNINWSVNQYLITTYTPNITSSVTTRRLIDAIKE